MKYFFLCCCFSFLFIHSLFATQQDSIDVWLATVFQGVNKKKSRKFDAVLFQKAMDLSKKTNYQKGIFDAYKLRGYYYHQQNNYLAAIADLKIASDGFSTQKDPIEVSTLIHLGQCYYRLNRQDEAERVIKRAIKLSQVYNLLDDKASSLAVLASIYIQQNRKSEALDLYLTAYHLVDSLNLPNEINVIASNIGFYYLSNNQPTQALKYIEKAHKSGKIHGSVENQAKNFGNLAYCYFLLKDFEKAYIYYDSSLVLSIKHQLPSVTYITYKDLADTYSTEGKYKEALKFTEKHFILKDAVLGANVQQKLNKIEVNHERVLKEQAIEKLVQAEKIRQQQSIITIGGLALFSFTAFLVLNRLISNNRNRKALLQHKEEILQKKEELIQNQSELHQLKMNALADQLKLSQKDIEYKQKDITNLALEMSRKHHFISQLVEKTEALRPKIANGYKKEWADYTRFIDTHLQLNEEKQIFQENIQQINQAFFNNLLLAFPTLTKTDKELCGYFRLDLSNKEIAILRNSSIKSINMGRYRLRKKLNLAPEKDITAFLQGF